MPRMQVAAHGVSARVPAARERQCISVIRLRHAGTLELPWGPHEATRLPRARGFEAPGMANPPPPERTAKCLTLLVAACASHRFERGQREELAGEEVHDCGYDELEPTT